MMDYEVPFEQITQQVMRLIDGVALISQGHNSVSQVLRDGFGASD